MLQELRVEQFAIIHKLAVGFGPGLNVVTGETGAGKSLLVDALGLAVGGRATAELVRAGAKEAVVEALFAPSAAADRAALDAALAERGLPSGEGVLLVKRVVSRSGRHRVYMNGGLATAGLLAQVAGDLVDISGQHEHMALLRPGVHLDLLDAFAARDPGFVQLRERYRAAWDTVSAAAARLQGLDTDETTRRQRESFLRFQLDEIEALGLAEGEDTALAAERRTLQHAGRLAEVAGYAEQALYAGEGAVGEVLGRVVSRLQEVARLDPDLAATVEQLEGALAVVEEAGRDLSGYAERLTADPHRLDEVEARLAALSRVTRKHGGDLAAVLAAAEAMRAELQTLTHHDDCLVQARAALDAAARVAGAAAEALSRARAAAAKELSAGVEAGLTELAMDRSRFVVQVTDRTTDAEGLSVEGGPSLGRTGADRVEFLLAPGPGEPARPLGKVASGGELSRVLLALRQVLAAGDPIPTVVFDEVDSGVGGAVAEVIGRLLKTVSQGRQVLCVTHLPQVAAFADRHVTVSKSVAGERARVEVAAVEGEARCEEVARMLGGSVTDRSREHAAEMIERAAAPQAPAAPGDRPRRPRRPATGRGAARAAGRRRSSG